MLTRVVYLGGTVLALVTAWLFREPPGPEDTTVAWPVFLIGAAALAAATARPLLLRGPIAWASVAVLAVAGMGLGLLAKSVDICCMYAVTVGYGFPYPWINKHAEYETLSPIAPPATFDSDATWSTDRLMLALGTWYWISIAIAAVVLIRSANTLIARRHSQLPPPSKLHIVEHAQHSLLPDAGGGHSEG